MAITRTTPNRDSHYSPRAWPIPIRVYNRPAILFVCCPGTAAGILITVLKCADYAITHAKNVNEAMAWLSRRPFRAIILDSSLPESELHARGKSLGIPLITISKRPYQETRTGITADSVKELLAAVFRLVPLDWVKKTKRTVA